jgi:2-polyprenyl-6-methoxyphenol hydroxylase-like FAD-dependent oxidoreductase
MVVQPRTLELLRPLGIAGDLLARGDPAASATVHLGRRAVELRLGGLAIPDTAHPYLLLLAQDGVEAVLDEHLTSVGVPVDRGVELVGLRDDGAAVTCELRAPGGPATARAGFVVGCDGSSSTVRRLCAIPARGAAYRHAVLMADVERADVEGAGGIGAGTLHAFVGGDGLLFLFPTGPDRPWRVLAPVPGPVQGAAAADVQAVADRITGGSLRLHGVGGAGVVPLEHRVAAAYRRGRVLLAGDAAHVHSPAGAQGMNAGIQDACNLGWKLALVCRGGAGLDLLDSYDAERRPVARGLLRLTGAAFAVESGVRPPLPWLRSAVAPWVLPLLLRRRRFLGPLFAVVGQLRTSYRLTGPRLASVAPVGRPRAGDRLPDPVVRRDGADVRLHDALRPPGPHLLLCGPVRGWDERALQELRAAGVRVQRLSRSAPAGGLHDPSGRALARLGVRRPSYLLVRPDGHVAVRGTDRVLSGAREQVRLWSGGVRPAAVRPRS